MFESLDLEFAASLTNLSYGITRHGGGLRFRERGCIFDARHLFSSVASKTPETLNLKLSIQKVE